ncbi:hypothetical protein RZE82_07045 [Mollicutes bacterium LVI A0039]|nr:hypothetical protein RZE82_07045 [Mollicutes bacterium LVI A0039]
MINGKQLKKKFEDLDRGNYYTDVAYEAIVKFRRIRKVEDVDVIEICGAFDEVSKKEAEEYKNATKIKLSNGNVLVHQVF